MRKLIVILCLTLLFLGIVTLFWRNEWVYSLPTPVPATYQVVPTGSDVDITGSFQSHGKSLFLHFFNPDCPCSRFNIEHFKSLVKWYGTEVSFGIVVLTKKNYSVKDIQDKFDLQIPVSFDTAIATACGVYSTPQAVIITAGHKLYFRGNYNKSRYCTDKNSNYAQLALEGILHKNANIIFDRFALTAYGCGVPKCKK